MKKLLIFDMDGTLVDSSLTIARAINFVRKNLSLPLMEEKKILKKVNDPNLNSAEYFYGTEAFTQEQERWFSTYYTEHHEEELQLYDGIYELLHKFKKDGFKLAIATNAYRVSTIQSLKHLKILDIFDTFACYDDVRRGKPHPEMLENLLGELKLEITEALFVGDSERDELAAKALKMDYIMVNWGFSEYDNAIQSLEELNNKIMEL